MTPNSQTILRKNKSWDPSISRFQNITNQNSIECARMLSHFSCVQLCATLWTVARQTPLSMGFSRQEYWSGLPCPPPGFFPTQGSNPGLFHCRQILYHWATREVPPVPATVINSERKGRAEIRAQLLKHFLNNQKNVHYNMGSHLTVMTSKQETQIASRHI